MELKPVDSKNVVAQGYDAEKEELHLQFKGGAVYAYDAVPAFVHRDFLDAPSKGSFFHKEIKAKYNTRKLTP